LIAGKERNVSIGDLDNPGEQQIGTGLGAFTDYKHHNQPPDWRKSNPNPGIAVRFAYEFGGQEILLFGMHKAPQLVQLAFSHRERLPQIEHDLVTKQCNSVQLGTGRIFIDLDDSRGRAERIPFGQCMAWQY